MKKIVLMLFVFSLLEYTCSQFLTIGTNRKPSKTACDSSTKSSLVEHFFNIIFTEFHNTPPVCVCVQMCPDQPTYCYPNGCLKREEKNKKPEAPMPVTKLSENTKPIFFIDEKNDFMNDFLTKNYIDESKVVPPPPPVKANKAMALNLRPDPFKDRYKILFKYKKMPKVELKYNLGEQVMAKNIKSEVMKSESVDVSKTRWPMNKIDRRLHGSAKGGVYNDPHLQRETNSRYFMSMFPDKEITNYPPKYFKRELPNNTNSENNDVDIKAIYVVGKTDSDNSAFSLEKLIDSLIESSFDNNSTTSAPTVNQTIENDVVARDINVNIKIKENSNNNTTNIISINSTNENIDKNKYTDDFINANHSGTFSEMIATLSKRIDKQNNTSLEMMRRITGEYEYDATNITVDKPIEATTMNTPTSELNTTTTETKTTETTTNPTTDYENKTTRKSRQRLARRLQHSKNN